MGFAADINDIRDNSRVSNSAAPAKNSMDNPDDLEKNFFNMLIAQLKNQDPTNPMQNHEMTSQIAQIQTVKGINTLNSSVNGLVGQIESKKYLEAAALKGRDVLFSGDSIILDSVKLSEEDEKEMLISRPFGYELISPADHVTITIKDKQGNVVHSIEDDTPKDAGVYSYQWNGEGLDGYVGKPGKYTFSIVAKNEKGLVANEPLMHGVVNSVSANANGPQLSVGFGRNISLEDIRQIL